LSDPIILNPGDVVFMQTDGIPEGMSKEKEFFADHRVLECLKNHRDKPAKEILNLLLEAVLGFVARGKQRDDMTAVIIKVLPRD
jgi:serine phosphatase RsbU (regulator of sigma subunit)